MRRAAGRIARAALDAVEGAASTSSPVLGASVGSASRCLHSLARQVQRQPQFALGTYKATAPATWAPLSCQGLQVNSTRSLFIRTDPTPNPQSLMFMPVDKKVMESGSYEFPNARSALISPLAKKLFMVDGISSVFFGSDFITITKSGDEWNWNVLKPDVFAAITEFYSSGEPLFYDQETLAKSDTAIHPDDDEVVAMIKELLETRIRPAVQEDGGDIVFKGFDEETGMVTVKMMGACSGCPSSTITLKSGIENMLMHYIPEVKGVVEAEPEEHEKLGEKEFLKLEKQLGER